MNPLDVLDDLARLGARLGVADGRLTIDAPAGAVTAEHLDAVRLDRELVVAVVLGWRTGHRLIPCNICGHASMVNLNAETWPTCRLTPGCGGRHAPAEPTTPETGTNVPKSLTTGDATTEPRLDFGGPR